MKLIAQSLTARRGGRMVFQNLSFTVRAGEALLLTGPNGSGKTTLIRMIAGFIAPAKGLLQLEAGASDCPVHEQCHYIGHLNAVTVKFTVAENLSFWAQFLSPDGDTATRKTPEQRLELAMERFGLTALRDIPGGYLSAGQKRRLGLARLLLVDRPLWLLDEPSVSLDRASVKILAAVVDDHVAGGGLVIAATHLPLGLKATTELQLGGTRGTA